MAVPRSISMRMFIFAMPGGRHAGLLSFAKKRSFRPGPIAPATFGPVRFPRPDQFRVQAAMSLSAATVRGEESGQGGPICVDARPARVHGLAALPRSESLEQAFEVTGAAMRNSYHCRRRRGPFERGTVRRELG